MLKAVHVALVCYLTPGSLTRLVSATTRCDDGTCDGFSDDAYAANMLAHMNADDFSVNLLQRKASELGGDDVDKRDDIDMDDIDGYIRSNENDETCSSHCYWSMKYHNNQGGKYKKNADQARKYVCKKGVRNNENKFRHICSGCSVCGQFSKTTLPQPFCANEFCPYHKNKEATCTNEFEPWCSGCDFCPTPNPTPQPTTPNPTPQPTTPNPTPQPTTPNPTPQPTTPNPTPQPTTPNPTPQPTTPEPTPQPTQEKPICEGCEGRPMECWHVCKKKAGFCTNCNSPHGTFGACCRKDNGGHYEDDPPAPECKKVNLADFAHEYYHMCVLVPATPAPTPALEFPRCTGCGDRPKECWRTCEETAGYCDKCDSPEGTRGACCMVDGNRRHVDDKHECKSVDSAFFEKTGYHVCVLPPPVPKCEGCGPQPLECWGACGNKPGWCEACNSQEYVAHSTSPGGASLKVTSFKNVVKGACCMKQDNGDHAASDPPECKAVDADKFRYTGYHMCVITPAEPPKCTGCGGSPMECWGECGRAGFCDICYSEKGTRGACCMKHDNGLHENSDPAECKAVKADDFKYTGYHMCVIVPPTATR